MLTQLLKRKILLGRRDVQDNVGYWNVPSRVQNDTGYLPPDYNPQLDNMVDGLYQWCEKHCITTNARIMELGCGGGRIMMLWDAARTKYETGWTLFGLDHASRAVDLAQTRVRNAHWFTNEIHELDTELDVIYTNTALQHNSGWKQQEIYPHIHRLLKPRGHLWLINEKTFSQDEVVDITGTFLPDYCDDRASAGTPLWWIQMVSPFGFELLCYENSSYTFRTVEK